MLTNLRIYVILFIFLWQVVPEVVYAQVKSKYFCGSAEVNNERLKQDPRLRELEEEQNRLAKSFEKNHVPNKSGTISYTIPVVYHVIHNYGPENISKQDIENSIANLNLDFQKLNPDISFVDPAFAGIAADCEVQFRLAHIDPNGNCTEGITRTVSEQTYSADNSVKLLTNWNTTQYLNIWVVHTIASGAGGYSHYPGFAPGQWAEGIVVRYTQLGGTVTHEVGHFLNLRHLWGNSNDPELANNCSDDDLVGDTPNTIGTLGGCNTSYVSCGSLDNTQNFMEYTSCKHMFTEGQKSRMHAALNSAAGSRNTLWTASNLALTGTNDPYSPVTCAPIADFTYSQEFLCEGATVTFNDESYNAVPTTWNWLFTGGTPSSSNNENPTITYNNEGVYSVTHQPSTSAGSGVITKSNIITVSSLVADYSSSIMVDGFENTTQFNNQWIINNTGGFQSWRHNPTVSYTGTSCVSIDNFFTFTDGDVEELISPSYDLSAASSKYMTFKQAFAKRDNTNIDRLLVFYSIDCGSTWILRLPLTVDNLTTAPLHPNPIFIPTASEWAEHVIDLSDVGNSTNIRFKFQFTSGGGNHIYIDDINIGEYAVGIKERSTLVENFEVYPNPTNSSARVSFYLNDQVQNLSIRLLSIVGGEVSSIIDGQSFEQGKYTLSIDRERKIASGVYLVEFRADDQVQTRKLIVE